MRWVPAGDRAAVAEWEDGEDAARSPAACAARIAAARLSWIVDVVPAYDTVTVVYDPAAAAVEAPAAGGEPAIWPFVESALRRLLEGGGAGAEAEPREVEIPVRYGGADGPDLDACAARAGMDPQVFIEAHASARYTVAMIGFMPGFPYLSGLPERLAQPRLASPRRRVPAGSVGIAGVQTGVYPFDSPGGWQIIGRTDLRLFDPHAAEPSLLRAGDIVRFVPVTVGGIGRVSGGAVGRTGAIREQDSGTTPGAVGASAGGTGGGASGAFDEVSAAGGGSGSVAGGGSGAGIRKEGSRWGSSSDRPDC